MKVTIKNVKGEIVELDCTPQTTVAALKEQIKEKNGHEVDTQKMIHRGKHLDDTKNLEELNIKDGDLIILMIQKKVVQKAPEPTPAPAPVQPTPTAPVGQPPSQATRPPVSPALNRPPVGGQTTPQQPPAELQEPLDPNNEIVHGMQHMEEEIQELMLMGFDREKIKQALQAAFFNKERAIEYLLSVSLTGNPRRHDAPLRKPAPRLKPRLPLLSG